MLRVHYKWLLKLLRKLHAMVNGSTLCEKTASEIVWLSQLIGDLNDQLESVYDPIKKISKRIKKYLALPPPHSSEICMDVHSGLKRITRDLDVRDKTGNILKRELKIASVQLKDVPAMRHQTVSLWSDVYSGRPIDETILQIVLEVERLCDESHIRLRIPAEIQSVLNRVRSLPLKETAQLNAKVQLWPIYEYVFLSLACDLQGRICREETISAATALECLARFANVPSIPSDLIGLLNAVTRTEVEQRQKTLLLPELFRQLAWFAQQSYAIRDSSLLLHWRGVMEEDIEKSLTSYVESKVCVLLICIAFLD